MKLAAVAAPLRTLTLPRLKSARRSRREIARGSVFAGAALTFAAFFGMSLAIETVKPEWRDPEFGHRLKQLRALHAAQPERPLIVALGSSRTQMGFSPAHMTFSDAATPPLAYNFGQSGAGPLHILLTLLRLLDDGVKPDHLLVELFPATLTHDGPAEEQFAKIATRLTLADLQHLGPYTRDITTLRKHWAENRVNAWYTQRITLISHWQPNWLPWKQRLTFQWQQMDAFGFTPYPHVVMPPGEREKGLEHVRADYAGMLADLHIGATADRAIRQLVQRCREEGIPVAFYITPESPAFRALYTPATRRAIDAYYAMLREELGVPIFDVTTGFAEDEFADGHHLLRHGAARFSQKLERECIRPWLGAQ